LQKLLEKPGPISQGFGAQYLAVVPRFGDACPPYYPNAWTCQNTTAELCLWPSSDRPPQPIIAHGWDSVAVVRCSCSFPCLSMRRQGLSNCRMLWMLQWSMQTLCGCVSAAGRTQLVGRPCSPYTRVTWFRPSGRSILSCGSTGWRPTGMHVHCQSVLAAQLL
jgi:hypothetical protein